jgi:HAD superfamily hydrolase (TIGR01509 family)
MAIQSIKLLNKYKALGLFFMAFGIVFCFMPSVQAVKIEVVPPKQAGYNTVIFDLGGVIFTTASNHLLFAKAVLGNPSLLYRLLSFDTKKEYFEVLKNMRALSSLQMFHQSQPMPQIMVDWQINADSSDNIKDRVIQHINQTQHPQAIKNLFMAIANFMFTPEMLAASQVKVEPMVKLLEQLKHAGYEVYALSNWNAESFAVIEQLHPEIFKLFNGVLISGHVHMGKPDPKFFELLFKQFNIEKKHALFIDDEISNVDAAEKIGLHSILCKNTKTVLEDLQEEGILNL